MRSSPIVVLLTFLLCTSTLGCELDRTSIPVRARAEGGDGGEEQPRDRDAETDEVDKPSSTAGGGTGDDEGGMPSQSSDGGSVDGGPEHASDGSNVDGGPKGTVVDPPVPLPAGTGCPGAACEFLSVCGGEFFSCGLLSSGRSVCWGDNTLGQLGREGTSRAFGYVQSAAQVPLEGISQVACGTRHACALLADHTVRCWGAGDEGQLGRGVVPNSPYASEALELPAAAQVVAGTDVGCARLQDGQVSCWGKNHLGQLARGTTSDEVLRPKVIAQLTGVTMLALRVRTVYAIAGEERQLLAWGTGRGAGPVTIQNEIWNDTIKGVHTVAAGAAHGCFVVGPEKRVLCTGWDEYGQSGQGTPGCGGWCENAMPVRRAAAADGFLAGVDQLVVNGHSSCAVVGGQVHCWGANSFGELGIGVANFTELDQSKVAIRTTAETTLAPEGEVEPSLSGIYLLGGGYHHFCAARKAGELLCWGHGDHGQLGFEIGASSRPASVPEMRLDP